MFIVEYEDGSTIRGENCYWDSLPHDKSIKRVHIVLMTPVGGIVANHCLEGCDAYGFQRYDITVANGGLVSTGIQLLGRIFDVVTVVDLEFKDGHTSVCMLAASDCTYAQHLWRQGCK